MGSIKMALPVPKTVMQQMMKQGAQHFKGLEEASFRNIDACKQLTQILRSSFGPNGMNKMVIYHLDKLFVTNDAATMLKELEVQHPAAKLLVMAVFSCPLDSMATETKGTVLIKSADELMSFSKGEEDAIHDGCVTVLDRSGVVEDDD